jgi:hypothetical protein
MKKFITILLSCLPLLAQAQTEAKYLEGAVPVEDGKVVFRTQMQVNALDKADLYRTTLKWADERFVSQDKFNARVVYADTLEGKIAVYGDEYLVFSSSALSLDRARINYQLQMNLTDGQCEAVLSRIRYTYRENERTPDKYSAEEWITDANALNKAKTKLLPVSGKFRRKTIDLKDELFKALQNAFGERLIEIGAQSAPVKPADLVSATPVRRTDISNPVRLTDISKDETPECTAQTEVPASQTEAPVTRIPLSTEQPVAAPVAPHHLMVTAGDDEQFKLNASSWGGESQLFGKHVTFVFVDTQKTAANLLLSGNPSYTVALYHEGEATPYVTLTCEKMSAQTISGTEAVKMNAALDANKSYTMYVGEIKNK